MRFLLTIVIGALVAGGIYYFVMQQQKTTGQEMEAAQNEAVQKADEYRENQAKMMRELGQ